jgi:hypothetical protein
LARKGRSRGAGAEIEVLKWAFCEVAALPVKVFCEFSLIEKNQGAEGAGMKVFRAMKVGVDPMSKIPSFFEPNFGGDWHAKEGGVL